MEMLLTPQEGTALCGLYAEDTSDIIVKTDRAGFIVDASAGIAQLGLRLDAMLVWPNIADLADGKSAAALRAARDSALAGHRPAAWVEFSPAPGLAAKPTRLAIQLRGLCDVRGHVAGALGVIRETGDRRMWEERLFIAEMTDALTGLTNRRAFMAMLGHLTAQPGRHAACLFDLDHFRTINIRHGQSTGDGVLMAFAEYLRAMLRSQDIVSRFGGETFGVLLPDTGWGEARAICAEVITTLDAIGQGAIAGGMRISASGGLARVSPCVDETIRRAELALFRAKAGGRNRLCTDGEDSAWKGSRGLTG